MQSNQSIRLFIIEDHQFIIDLYLGFFSKYPQLEVLGYANDSQTAIPMLMETQPDVVLLDLQLKNSHLDGFDLIKKILGHNPAVRIFVLTQFSGDVLLKNLSAVGVHGFREKSVGLEELTQAIIRISSDNIDFQFSEENVQIPVLTEQERIVLKLKALGNTLSEVSHSMGLSVDVLDRMLRRMRDRAGVVSTESLIYNAAKLHLI